MKHPVEVKRLFTKTDEEMLQQADVQLALFTENKHKFVERFTPLADPFATEWGNAITTAREILPDFVSVAGQSSATDALESFMDQGRNSFQTLVLYTQLAYPGNATVMRLMGQPQYEAARKNQLKLPVLLQSTYSQASKPEYKTALIAKGIKEAEIDALRTIAESIMAQNATQEKSKKDRSLGSTDRILAMNAVWERMALVSQCAKLVFQDNATLYAMFLLNDGNTATPAQPVIQALQS